ncbi:MAG TPA: type II toxin-antitoxin system VapC family toxin [Candidatus Acidoferrum sp.]|nr:type II toxin-antitoxin system VapC family toxin [Candidatus Acidoferrum sp.]
MNLLLDTNVISEWSKPRPNSGVIRWLAEQDEDRIFMSVVTMAELRHGLERLPKGGRQEQLRVWIEEDLRERFEGRILSIDESIAGAWGKIMAASERSGRRMNVMDGFIAATAAHWKLTLVTRNVTDFAIAGCEVLSPWTEES